MSGKREKCSRYISAFCRAGFNVSFESPLSADALCLCGGGDVSPCLYGSVNKGSVDIDIERDVSELYHIRRFLDKNMPIIAICRGLQVVNVYFGGTLRQHEKSHSQIGGEDIFHEVKLFGSLKNLYGDKAIVNSAHHQTVAVVGDGLSVTALAKDGVVEGLSRKNLVAFQFHPERLSGITDGSKIFSKFYSDNFD